MLMYRYLKLTTNKDLKEVYNHRRYVASFNITVMPSATLKVTYSSCGMTADLRPEISIDYCGFSFVC